MNFLKTFLLSKTVWLNFAAFAITYVPIVDTFVPPQYKFITAAILVLAGGITHLYPSDTTKAYINS